jgi:hypothetical protein
VSTKARAQVAVIIFTALLVALAATFGFGLVVGAAFAHGGVDWRSVLWLVGAMAGYDLGDWLVRRWRQRRVWRDERRTGEAL